MSKLILFNMVTLDGYFTGPGGDINWHTVDEEFNQFAVEQLNTASGLIFGRVTYELMANYWPTPAAIADDPGVANRMNALPKIVFSRTLSHADWHNTRMVNAVIPEEINQLKQQPGGDLLLFGSARLTAALAQENLIDEYRLMFAPVILGDGRPLFENIPQPLKLNLLHSRKFQNGNLLQIYHPAGTAQ